MHNISFSLRLFASVFASHFEALLEQEIAKPNFRERCRRPGVLVAHGMVLPSIVALYKSARLALRTRPGSVSARLTAPMQPSPAAGAKSV